MDKKSDSIKINCSNCSAPLVEIWTVPSEENEEEKQIRAECPHCDDSSFLKKVSGKFYLGATKFTGIEEILTETNESGIEKSFIKTSKVKDYGK